MKSRAALLLMLGLTAAAAQQPTPLEELADGILKSISALRELEPLREVDKGILSREQIEEVFRRRIAQDYSPEDLERERRLLVKLGALPAEYNYVEETMQVLNEQVAGFYDPQDKTLFIADWLPPESQQMTMAHELTHALQDQHYDLEKILSNSDRNGDALLARRAIVEGDAVGVMFDYLLNPLHRSFAELPNLKELYEQTLNQQQLDESGSRQLQQAPPFIRDSLLFSYVFGARFMQLFCQSRSWKQARDLYAQLPTSTEQIIHPEKFLVERDDPTPLDVAVDDALTSWEIEYSDVFGEFQAQLALRTYLGEESSKAATTGWDGDRIRLLSDQEGRLALQWDTIWDSPEEAAEFRNLYAQLIRIKYSLGEPEPLPDSGLGWETEFDRIRITGQDLSVRILEVEKVPVRRQ